MGNDYTVANKTASNYGQHISITFWQLPEDYSREILILLQIEFCSLYIATYGETGLLSSSMLV